MKFKGLGEWILRTVGCHQKSLVFGVILVTFFLSLSYSFHFQITPTVDARAYDNIGWEFSQTGVYPVNAIGRPGPGYEFFLAGVYSVFGHTYQVIWILQAILLTLTAGLVFLISKEVFRGAWHPLIGLVAAVLVGFSPDLILISSLLMTETVLLFLLTLAVWLIFKYLNSDHLVFLIVGAVILALGALVRGNVSTLFLPALIFLLWKKKWLPALIFSLMFFLTLTPWTIHNYRVYHVIKPFNAAAGLLYLGNHEGATGELETINFPIPASVLHREKLSQLEYDDAMGAAGRDYILSHPLQFIKLAFWRLSIYFSVSRPFAFWPHLVGVARAITVALSSFYALIILGLGLLGMTLALRKDWPVTLRDNATLLFGMFLILPLTIAALVAETRYRFPAYPFLAIFAGWAVYCLCAKREVFTKWLSGTTLIWLVFLSNTLFDIIRNFDRILDRL